MNFFTKRKTRSLLQILTICAALFSIPTHSFADVGIDANADEYEKNLTPTESQLVEKAQIVINRLIDKELPELKAFKVVARAGHQKGAVFWSSFRFLDIFRKPENREYRVMLSLNYLDRFPSETTWDAVILHELYHILDYSRMDGVSLRTLLVNLGLNPHHFVPHYERCTDFRALLRGSEYVSGMLEYREWQQTHMSERLRKKKLRNYFTPDELRSGTWKSYEDCPELP